MHPYVQGLISTVATEEISGEDIFVARSGTKFGNFPHLLNLEDEVLCAFRNPADFIA